MKKVLALVLALVLCLSIGAITAASAEGEGYTVVVHRYGTADQTGVAAVQEAINAWLANNGYKFNVDISQVRDGNTIQVKLAAKDHIDIFWSNASDLTNTLLAGNFLYDIGGIYKDYEGLYNSMPENIWNTLLRNGGESLYQIPCYKEAGLGLAYVVKKSDAEKFGWTEIIANDPTRIWTLEELEPYIAEAAATGEYDYPVYGYSQLGNASREYPLIDTYACVTDFIVVDFVNGDGKTAQKITEVPEYIDQVNTWVKWYEAGYVSDDFATATNTDQKPWCFFLETMTPDFQANMDNRYAKWDETGVYYMPTTGIYLTSTSALGSAYSIASYTEDIDACMQFMDAIYSNSEIADLYLYGIEDVNYTRLEDGSCQKIADTGYNFATWATSNVMVPSLENTDSANKKEQYALFNQEADNSVLMGFVFDRTPVEAEYAACNAVKAEYMKLVEMGFYGAEGLQQYSDALDAAGIDVVIAEAQTQLDAFFAAK